MVVVYLIYLKENTILCQVLETYHEINTRSLPIDKVKQSCFSILEEIHSTGLLSDCERRYISKLLSYYFVILEFY